MLLLWLKRMEEQIMEATHKVQDSRNKLVGFMIDNKFFTDYFVVKNIDLIDNLFITEKRVIESENKLPVIQYKEITKIIYEDLIKQNPFERDIQKDLLAWKNNPLHKVLQVEGSRQIGKTTEILKFAYQNYEYVIYVNLATDEYTFIDTVINEGSHILAMEAYCRKANLPHFVNNDNTILIIDEIQINSKAYNSIRTINGGLDCDFIVTGSYLGRLIGDKNFFIPAGTISLLKMLPLSFSEFCRIYKKDQLLEMIDLYGNAASDDYEKLFELYDIYRKIGGYPEVLKTYLKTNSIDACYGAVGDLLELFKQESRYYFSNDKEISVFDNVYTEAVKQMCSEKKGSGIKLVEDVTQIIKKSQKCILSRDEVARAIRWIIYAGIIGECNLSIDGSFLNMAPSRRLYYMDCGIAAITANRAGLPPSTVDGFLTENFVYTELYRLYKTNYANSKVRGDLPCFSTYSNYELDFIVLAKDGARYGIEVKTKSGDPKSLKIYIDKKLIDKGIVAKRTIGGHGEKYDSIPIYAVGARFPYHDTNNSVHMSLLD